MVKNTLKNSQFFVQWRLNNAKEGSLNSGILITVRKTPK